MNLLDLFRQGGWIMWPLLLCSLLSLGIVIERLINLRPARFLPPVITTRLETLVESRSFNRALTLCRERPGVFPNLVRASLESYPFGRDAVKEAIESAGRREIPRVGRYLGTLSTVVGIAPLLGLLGTVLGMIQVFTVVAQQGLGQASSLAGGIAVALVTTAFGLMVAIPSLVMYNVFSQRAENIVLDIESRVTALTNRLFHADGSPVAEAEETTEMRSATRPAGAEVRRLMPLPRMTKREARIDISPLVDVVFQLLIFFVVSTTFLNDEGLPLELPQAESGEQASTVEELSVRVSSDGALRFRGEMTTLVELEQELRSAIAESPSGAVTIYGDGRVDYETVVQIIDLARRAEARGVVLATEEIPAQALP